MKYRLLSFNPIIPEGVKMFADHDFEVVICKAPNYAGRLADVKALQPDAIFCRVEKIDAAMIAADPNLKCIGKQGAGLDNIDLPAATAAGVQVAYSPAGNMETVAEHASMLILMCSQRYRYVDNQMRRGNFGVRFDLTGTHDLTRRTIGFIGCGRISQCLADIMVNGFHMHAIGYDPFMTPDRLRVPVELKATADEVWKEADIVSIHLQSNAETRHSVGYKQFSMMKPSALFINCARGDLVVEDDLIRALEEGKIAGAGLDVFEQEPLPLDHKFLTLENVCITPHMGAATEESYNRCTLTTAEGMIGWMTEHKVPAFPGNTVA